MVRDGGADIIRRYCSAAGDGPAVSQQLLTGAALFSQSTRTFSAAPTALAGNIPQTNNNSATSP